MATLLLWNISNASLKDQIGFYIRSLQDHEFFIIVAVVIWIRYCFDSVRFERNYVRSVHVNYSYLLPV